jgi:hypothetical protein
MNAVQNYNVDVFTTEQLLKVNPAEVNDEMRKRDYKLWECAFMFHLSPERERFRADLARFEREAKQRNAAASLPQAEPTYPTFAPSFRPQATGVLSREQITAIAKPVGRYVREKVREATAGLASAEVVSSLMFRVTELESRIAQYEKRLSGNDNRLNAHSKHLENLEKKIREGQ